ncbi:protease modulator HflC [Kiloniella laminariae]|uniref:Protein HflC n=1 Tax=Kiloniella laminariae TaxID=454162 RepID=A0ABT4LI21_9PROT|nr:protease modulator HflC [Kiloniella laminariae]MCZ4280758.1 protease modulator HflC [Kiloniella laminariae]
MNNKITLGIGAALLLGAFVSSMSLFTIYPHEQAMVLEFGNPQKTIQDPGLYFKTPWQDVQKYEKRVLNLDPPVERMILSDQKPLLVDTFARYRIADPLAFFTTVRSEEGARARLGTIINAGLRGELGKATLSTVLSEERNVFMQNVLRHVNTQAKRFGIDVLDIRIRRADLPNQTSQAVFNRMKTEREREAAEFRAQGFEQAQRIKSTADREATVITAEAKKESEILRGQGDAALTKILNDAYGQDPDFFKFYRSMQAYEASLNKGTYMVLSPDSDFFEFFDGVTPD